MLLTDNGGGNVCCFVRNTELYLQKNGGTLEKYKFSKQPTFCYISCCGEEFGREHNSSIDIYDCYCTFIPADMTKVSMSVLGKNLFDISKVKSTNNTIEQIGYGISNNEDGSLTVRQNGNSAVTTPKPNTLKDLAPNLKVGATYILSAKSNATTKAIRLREAEKTWYYDETKDRKLTITEEHLNSQVYWYSGNGVTATISDIQIELGSTATEYEPYTEYDAYTVNADGSVDGVRSVYPSMTFIPDTEGVTLDVEYNRDINKAFAQLQAALISMGGNV